MKDMIFDLLLEFTIMCVVLYTTNYVWKRFKTEHQSKKAIENNLEETKHLATVWEKKSKEFIRDFQGHVIEKFSDWNLSKSEREIALLILQGKSSKDISNIRFTSERTIRNQCRSIYEKAGLKGKNELSAFFLNELVREMN